MNLLKDKSFNFAIRIVKLCKYLNEEKKELILSKQILRSGTSIGAMVSESEHSESKSDFIHKLAIAQKETNETLYWLKLLYKTDYISQNAYESINEDALELMKIITASIKTAKQGNHY
ncbi:four helix bundle protein [Bacteroides sp. ET489]|jgi:four helix bundle protein|uniref:four helix bundle protein n=1 Tax=Bacteroides sp. ET489 TaxID=3057126 RepID=UPI00267219E1|nr:four helix bundle protein [Bacteroides sp. ET489]MDO3389364.1 four helix bundle protein [Bacteroides sp. ET489]